MGLHDSDFDADPAEDHYGFDPAEYDVASYMDARKYFNGLRMSHDFFPVVAHDPKPASTGV